MGHGLKERSVSWRLLGVRVLMAWMRVHCGWESYEEGRAED